MRVVGDLATVPRMGKRRWLWILGGVLALGAVQEFFEDRSADDIPRPIAKPVEKPEPCADLPVASRIDVVACDELGGDSGAIELRDEAGTSAGSVAAGTRIVRLVGEGVRRAPGHVDAPVCMLTGELAGRVAYIKNTHIFGGKACDVSPPSP